MGANSASEFSEDLAADPAQDPASELYLAVASMRANAVRMKAIAQTPDAEASIGDYRSESRRPHVVNMRTDYERMHADHVRDSEGAATAPPHDSYNPGFHPQGRLDAAAEHLERGRLPDLNALAEMMMDLKAAQRAYEVNLQMVDATHAMMTRTVDLLKR